MNSERRFYLPWGHDLTRNVSVRTKRIATVSLMLLIAILGLARGVTVAAAEATPRLPPPPDSMWVKRLFDGWRAPVPPRHLVGNIYYVGAIGVSSFLITTPQGHILLDTGFDDTVPIIQHGVEQLGFKVSDIKFIISSHAHIDHVG